MGVRRLRRDRHDAPDRRRAAVRSRRPARRRARARRGRRQRQRDARGGAPLRQRDLHRLRAGAARARPAARRSRRPRERHLRGGGRRGAAVSGRELRRRALDLRRDVRARPRAAPRASCCGCAGPAGRIGLACWTPAGFLGQLLRLVARTCRRPPGVQSPLLWGTDAHIQELFAGATKIEHTARQFAFRYQSRGALGDVFRDLLRARPQGVRGARCERPGRAGGRPAGAAAIASRGWAPAWSCPGNTWRP